MSRGARPPRPWAGAVASSIWWVGPILLALLIVVPRLLSPQFGLLDDARTLTTSRAITSGSWDMTWDAVAGRFRPAYWLYPALIYLLAGQNAGAFFAGNALLFAGATAALIRLVRIRGGSRLEAGLVGTTFALASPAIEATYTLSKAETLQVVFLALALVGAEGLADPANRRRRWGSGALTSIALLGALLTKETTLVLPPILALWTFLAWLRRSLPGGAERLRSRALFLSLSLGAAVIYLGWRGAALGAGLGFGEGTYASRYDLSPENLVASAVRVSGWLLRDFPYLVPLGLIGLWLIGRRRDAEGIGAHLEDAIWVAGWGAVFLPWPSTTECHLLPASIGCALLAGRLAALTVKRLGSLAGPGRRIALGALGLAVVGVVLTLPNNWTSARVQLAVDAANGEAIEYVVQSLPAGAHLVVNLQEPREYYEILGIYLSDLYGRGDLVIDYYRSQGLSAVGSNGAPTYVLSPFVFGKPYFTVRVGVGETDSVAWNESLLAAEGERLGPEFETLHEFRRVSIDLPAAICPILRRSAYCEESRAVFNAGVFIYGWRLYRMDPA